MSRFHEQIKYGDIIYIEFLEGEFKERMVLTSTGFDLDNQTYIETKKIELNQSKNIYLKDFEDNLFIIFPTMNENYLVNKEILDEKISQLIPKIELSDSIIDDLSGIKDLNKIITTFQETKKDVYLQNEKLIKEIGTPIKFNDHFTLIHFKSQMFVAKYDVDSAQNQQKSKLILNNSYTDDCIFLFSPSNKYDDIADCVFSNQNIFIRKKEKNMWTNNQYLTANNINGTTNYFITYTEEQINAKHFQIKICSNYIEPSSANLSFANPIWICCQNYDKYLIMQPKKKACNAEDDYSISFASIYGEKTMNNIYGLFNVEQIEKQKEVDLIGSNQGGKTTELRMSETIEYNKKIRIRHVASKKYLGFTEGNGQRGSGKNQNILSNDPNKKQGRLTLDNFPNENCDWIFFESYKIIERDKYEKAKEEGLKLHAQQLGSNEEDDANKASHIVKKKEILRLFHLKTLSFLSFDELNHQLNHQMHPVSYLTLNKMPKDTDLVRLMPSKENHVWEIHCILYFNKLIKEQIASIIQLNIDKYLQGEEEDDNINDYGQEEDLESCSKLKVCFEQLSSFCLNEFSRRFDIIALPGKPLQYRQNFLYDQDFLKVTFDFLDKSKKFKSQYKNYLKIAEQNLQSKNTPDLADSKAKRQSTLKKNKVNSTNLKFIGKLFKEINLSITSSFEFISAMCKNNKRNKEYVFNNKVIFNDYFLDVPEASQCFINIIKDDETYLNEIIKNNSGEDQTSILDIIINYLNNSSSYDVNILSLLSKMMKSTDKGITSIQEYIFNALFTEKKDKFMIKITPRHNDTVFQIVYRNDIGEYISRELMEFCNMKTGLTKYEKNIIKYFAEELNLLADLCFGRNYVCIERILMMFPLGNLIYHICNIELYEEVLCGLINILNYVYIDIEPHQAKIYPTMIKIVNDDLTIGRDTHVIKTYLPLDKLNLILCISLFLLHNIKNGKILVNSANINLIFNIIQFRLYENIEYCSDDSKGKTTRLLDHSVHNLKEDVKEFIISGEKAISNKGGNKDNQNEENKNEKAFNNRDYSKKETTFYDKIGHKFLDYDYCDNGAEYLIFVLDHINDFFLNRIIIDNIDANMENKNIIAQTFNSFNKTDILTQNNVNYLLKNLIQIKMIFTSGHNKKMYGSVNHSLNKSKIYISVIKQIAKVIDFILNIKKDDMVNKILENILKVNKGFVEEINSNIKDTSLFKGKLNEMIDKEFSNRKRFKAIMMENEYCLYQLFNNLEQFSSNSLNKNGVKKGNHPIGSNNEQASLLQEEEESPTNKNEFPEITNYQGIHKVAISDFNINYENEYLNSITFKTLQQLIIKILEVNVDERLTKILVRLFARIHSQRKELVECIKNIRLIYGDKAGINNEYTDIGKYHICSKMIGELSILTEKTEKWMTESNDETVNENKLKKTYLQLNQDDNEDDETKGGSFQRVIQIIRKLIEMCYDQKTKGCFINQDKLHMIQTMFFSFQLDETLFSLLREICQVFPEVGEDITYNQKRFKKKLEEIIKGIFKLLKCLIHNASDYQQAIIDNINQYSPYPYLNHLGLIDLFTEIISKNGAFAIENVKYLMEDLIMNNFTLDAFKRTFDYLFKENQEVASKEVKNCIHILQLVKEFIKQVKENKYLNIIIPTYESIIKEFEVITKCKVHPLIRINNNANLEKIVSDVSQKHSVTNIIQGTLNEKEIQMKKIKIVNFLAKIGFILIKSNESVKGLITKLFSMEFIKDHILKKKNEISNANTYNITGNQTKQYNYFNESYWKYLYKTKYLYTLYLSEIKQSQIVKNKLKELYQMYKQDEELFKRFKETEGELSLIIKDTFYHYFKHGIINSFNALLKNIKDELNLQQFNLILNEIEEGVEDLFKDGGRLNTSQLKNKPSLTGILKFTKETINITHHQTDTKFEDLLKQYNQNKIKTEKNQIESQLAIQSTEEFIHRIEKITTKYVNREIKLLARSLKSKINFHRVVQLYINDALALADDMSDEKGSNFHLFNIFLKFIQENYLSKKYYQQIIFIIELFAHFIEAKAEVLKSQDKNNIMLRKDFFKRKIRELKDVFEEHCQRLFLHNGSVEVFLKIVCEGNKQFNFEIFPSVLKFFNKVLDGGNTLAQDKFYHLFLFFQNSDNIFYYIKQLFDDDIYVNLPNELTITESRADMDNLCTITSLLRYLQLLTENHYQNLQSYLRDQASNRLSYNFVTILVEYISMLLGKLGNLYETNQQLSRATTKLYYFRLLSVLETMCEFLQGPCEKNQETLINTKIIEFFDKILRETELCSCSIKTEKYQQKQKLFYQLTDYEKSMVIYKISLVLLAIIEGRKSKDVVIRKIFRDFDYKLIYEKMNEINQKITPNQKYFLYSEEIDEYDKETNKQIVAEAGFNLYYFFEALQEIENEETEFKKYINLFFKDEHRLSKLEKENLKEIEPNYLSLQKTVKFFKENSINIEIVKDEQVIRVYCPRLPLFKNLSEDMMKTFQENANRSSIQTKLNSLFVEKSEMYETVKFHEHNYELFSKTGPLKILFIYPKIIQIICIVMSILLNILIFLGYNQATANTDSNKNLVYNVSLFTLSNADSTKILSAIGIVLMIISIWYVFLFFQSKTPISFHKLENNYYQDLFNQKAKNMSELETRRIDSILITTVKDFFNKILIYILVLKNWYFLYELIYIVFGLLGLFEHFFFFAFYLTEFIQTQPILRNVLKAVYQPILQLLYIFIFFIILLYFYCLVIFYFFFDTMPENSCNTIPICLASVYSNTFTSGGNLGNFIDSWDNGIFENLSGDFSRYVLDITFTIIIVWLVFQMVSGLILDTFTSLRKNEEDVDNDIRNICFICGLEREKIEKYYIGKEGFSKHLNDHNTAFYLFYMFYLEEKDPNEYSGIESYIKEMLDQESIAWFPIERCIMIEEAENKSKDL